MGQTLTRNFLVRISVSKKGAGTLSTQLKCTCPQYWRSGNRAACPQCADFFYRQAGIGEQIVGVRTDGDG